MKILGKFADRLLDRVVPGTTAAAAPCEYQAYACIGGRTYLCWFDRCTHTRFGCVYRTSYC